MQNFKHYYGIQRFSSGECVLHFQGLGQESNFNLNTTFVLKEKIGGLSRHNVVHSNFKLLSLDICLMANALRDGEADLPSAVWGVGKGLV